MTENAAPIRTGVLVWNQHIDWPGLRRVAGRIDELGYDSLWTWDHLYPIFGRPDGPFLEGYTVLAGWSQSTTRPSLGLLAGANTFRNPGLVVKMVTTLDHLSGGRAVLGIGAAWFETEHTAFGLGARRALPRVRRAQRPAAGPDAPPDPHRRGRRAQDAAHRGALRGRLERGPGHAGRSRAQGCRATTLVR